MFVSVLFFILIMLLMLVPGFILRKTKLIGSAAIKSFVAVLLYVCSPLLIFKSLFYNKEKIANPTEPRLVLGLLLTAGVSIVIMLATFFICQLLFFKEKNRSTANAYIFAGVFGNVGFIGIPFIEYILKTSPMLPYALLYASVFNIIFNVLCWTLGVYIITRDFKSLNPKKLIFNPIIIVSVIALPLFFLKVDLTKYVPPIADAISFLGAMTTPLSMIIVGIRLADVSVKSIVADGWAYLSSAARMLIAPLIAFLLVMLLRAVGAFGVIGGEYYNLMGKAIATALIVLSGLPAAASTIAFCEKFRGDSKAAVASFMNSTFLALIVMPLVVTLFCSFL